MDVVDHEKRVLGTIFSGRDDLLDLVAAKLEPEHFTDSVARLLFIKAVDYFDNYGSVLPKSALSDIFRGLSAGIRYTYEEFYDSVISHAVTEDRFRWSVDQLRDLAAERATGEAITTAMQVLRSGWRDGKKDLKGHADARSFLLSAITDIDASVETPSSPEGDVRDEEEQILEDINRRVLAKAGATAVSTGIELLDSRMGGGQHRGELNLIVGYTSSGKTKFCSHLAWTAYTSGRNVVYFTSETLRDQVRLSILARHSGFNTRDLKTGILSGAQQQKLSGVVREFTRNPAYGHLLISQVPRGATIATLEGRLLRLARYWLADLVIVDYLALLNPDGRYRYRDLRESLVEVFKQAKQVAATYADGRGVAVCSPWQVSRSARDDAWANGQGYTLNALSETAEASNISDVVLALLEPKDDHSRGRSVPVSLSVLKNRDGERGGDPIALTVDYATARFSASAAAGSGLAMP